MLTLDDKTVIVFGGSSMVGRAVSRKIEKLYPSCTVINPSHDVVNLLDWANVSMFFKFVPKIDYIINCAGWNGGLPLNMSHPATIYFRTTQINLNVMRAAVEFGVSRVISPISSCAYPDSSGTMEEGEFWNGLPNPTVECHGLAKRNIHAFGRQINKQFSETKSLCCVVNNSYGPYDSFDVNKTKVVGALIKKFVEAVELDTKVTCFGTGSPRRDLVYCDDAAEGILTVLQKWDSPDPVNIGGEVDYSIKEIAEKIAEITGYAKEIEWDTTKPDGQAKKMMSVELAKSLGFQPTVALEDGLKQTIQWYKENRHRFRPFTIPSKDYL